MSVVDDRVESIPASPRARRLVWAVCAVVLVAASIPAAIWFTHWRSTLHGLVDFPTYGAGMQVRAGTTWYFGDAAWAADSTGEPDGSSDRALDVSAVRPVVRDNTAAARVVVLRCVRRGPGRQPTGGTIGDAHDGCSTLVRFASGPVTFGERTGDDDLVLAVTPTRPGVVRIAGMTVRFSSGLRHGVQRIGPQITIRSHT